MSDDSWDTDESYSSQTPFNIALHKPAFQSRTYKHPKCGMLNASLAVDGHVDSNVNNCHCSHSSSAPKSHEWFIVDLGSPFKIDYVTIYNRKTGECFYNFFIYII